ncbi:MAG TPA: GNAT family protein [Sphingobacteriaceae bacterium]
MKFKVQRIGHADLAIRTRWLNDDRVSTFQFLAGPVTLQSTTSWYHRVKHIDVRCDLAFRDPSGKCLGMAGLTSINTVSANAEFYIFINPDFQGRGVGKAVTEWMLFYAFRIRKLLKVYLYVDPRNTRAVKLYENLHFTREGVLRKHRSKAGVLFDMHVYGILKDEWLAGRTSPQLQSETYCFARGPEPGTFNPDDYVETTGPLQTGG